jgi:hypothetical protein
MTCVCVWPFSHGFVPLAAQAVDSPVCHQTRGKQLCFVRRLLRVAAHEAPACQRALEEACSPLFLMYALQLLGEGPASAGTPLPSQKQPSPPLFQRKVVAKWMHRGGLPDLPVSTSMQSADDAATRFLHRAAGVTVIAASRLMSTHGLVPSVKFNALMAVQGVIITAAHLGKRSNAWS